MSSPCLYRIVTPFLLCGVTILMVAFTARTAPRLHSLLSDPIVIAQFDFDDENGAPDPQGWDARFPYQQDDSYFHVEDFTGAGQQAFPLEGNQSMWCGLDAEDPRTCHWFDPPGYGDSWSQALTSAHFTVQGDVTIDFLMDLDVETTYDYIYLEYENTGGGWSQLDAYSCGDFTVNKTSPCGPLFRSYTVPAASHGADIRFRFKFQSDGAGSTEGNYLPIFHKAFVLDSVTVSDATGVIHYEDFEGEAVDDTVTQDGAWYGHPYFVPENNHGFLVDGDGVLQESPTFNGTNFWAFYNGSDRDYGCAGHPEQLVVPEYTRNVIHSPMIDITHDQDGHPIDGDADTLEVSFDVYRDLPTTASNHYTWLVQTFSETCLLNKRATSGIGQGAQKDWYRHRVVFVPGAGTRFIRVDIGVSSNYVPPGSCPSHSPLIDNVTVTRIGGTVTAVGDQAPHQLVLRQNRPNPFNPATSIEYEVPANAGRVTLAIYDVAGRRVRTLVAAARPAGPAVATWDGRNAAGERVASGVYFYRLTAGEARVTRRMVLLK